jgi:hypothetical protein
MGSWGVEGAFEEGKVKVIGDEPEALESQFADIAQSHGNTGGRGGSRLLRGVVGGSKSKAIMRDMSGG